MKILFVSMHTSPVAIPGSGDAGGMNVVEWNIATALARQGHDVTLVTRKTNPDDPDTARVAEHITLVTLPAGPLSPLAKSAIDAHIDEFREGLRTLPDLTGETPDIVHSHHWMSGVAALDVARAWKVPHVQSFHSVAALPGSPLSSGEPPESPARVPGERVTAQTSDAVVAISAAEAGTVVQRCGASADRVHIIAPGVDREQFHPGTTPVDHDPGYAVFAARLQPLKGPDLAMRALAHVEKWLRPRLVIAGDYSADFADYGRDLAALDDRLGLADEVEFVGGQDREQLAELIRGARLMLVPSHSETFGLIALEAAASGVPVIAAAAGGLREAVVHGETGQLMDSRDPADWGKAITHVLTTPGLHERMSAVAPIHARRFDWNHTARALVELYGELQQRTHPAPPPSVPQEASMSSTLLHGIGRVAFVHAHPDDETIATGALIAHLRERVAEVRVLTATRGEQGEIVPGAFDVSDADALHHAAALDAERERELGRALAALGVDRAEFLGQGAARAAGSDDRRYSDSGMRWVTPSVAGPALDSPAHAFSLSPLDEVTTDIAAWLEHVAPDLVVTYDALGGYGHPDHVTAREATERACQRLGLPLAEVFQSGHSDRFGEGSIGEGVEWLDLADQLEVVKRALGQHRTQLTVDGDDIVHVGGQREPITVRVGLRMVP